MFVHSVDKLSTIKEAKVKVGKLISQVQIEKLQMVIANC